MKITHSLRVYVLMSMLVTGVGIIWTLSAISGGYFISGMDMAMRQSMFVYAQQQTTMNKFTYIDVPESTSQEQPRTIKYLLTNNWEHLPALFQYKYKPSELALNTLYKILEETSLLSPPKTGSFLMKVEKDNKIYYVSVIISQNKILAVDISNVPHLARIALTALVGMVIFTLILFLVMRQVAKPVEKLKDWAKGLDNKQLSKPIPDFHYSELNTLARLIKKSLNSLQDSLERERTFLGYASHELRTPIAVSRSNSELLKKLIENKKDPKKQLEVVARILRASLTMTDLTETLLWLNRREGKELTTTRLQLGTLTKQLVSDLTYLTQGKAIRLEVETDNALCELPEGACRIIISNLIRNAFQHTMQGHVSIKQTGEQFLITNINDSANTSNANLGFGLGLELTKRIIQQYGWQYKSTEMLGGKNVLVVFLNLPLND